MTNGSNDPSSPTPTCSCTAGPNSKALKKATRDKRIKDFLSTAALAADVLALLVAIAALYLQCSGK
jgi:hypothetical protein